MPTILVVDDSDIMRDQISADLQSAGYSVIEGENGEAGLAKAISHEIDLIITDFNMPKMDGLSMCVRLNPPEKIKKTPIFMLTTQFRPDLKESAKAAGIIAWIIKPYNKSSLIEATQKICGLNNDD